MSRKPLPQTFVTPSNLTALGRRNRAAFYERYALQEAQLAQLGGCEGYAAPFNAHEMIGLAATAADELTCARLERQREAKKRSNDKRPRKRDQHDA